MDARELKQYESWKSEVQDLRMENQHLRLELMALRPENYRLQQRFNRLEDRYQKILAENKHLKQRVKDLALELKSKPKPPPPAFVKVNVVEKARKRPGRKKGHPAALRPVPAKIDVHQQIPLGVDAAGKVCCPRCKTQLSGVRRHKRLVEEIIPAKVVTTCYHTTSGYCPSCRVRTESRAPEQPPAANLPHAQLGLNALATAAVMRVCYRLPLRQITALFTQLNNLTQSPGGIVKQIKRLGKWLEQHYERLKLSLRLAGVVHADETGWRTNGKNGYLWTLTNADHTLYHVDKSRGGQVLFDLLGRSFGEAGGKLVSDFYGVYDQMPGVQQKCLAHLLRELKDTQLRRPELDGHAFFKRCRRLVREMLKLKADRGGMKRAEYETRVARMEARLAELSEQTWNDPDADRLGKRLRKHRRNLTTFLHHAEVEGTNNAAERALRPAVVMRKITGGSRGKESAHAWAILASVMRTTQQHGRDVLETIKTLLRAEWAGEKPVILDELLMPLVRKDTS